MNRGIYYIITAFVYLLINPTTAFAYIDPGTGSMILQALGVAFIAITSAFVAFKDRIYGLFKKNKDRQGVNEEEKATKE